MTTKKVGLLSPGDMGHVVAGVLIKNGMPVITCLEGRSARTRSLSADAGVADVASYQELVREAGLILSILVPAEAKRVAEKVMHELAASSAGAEALNILREEPLNYPSVSEHKPSKP